MSVNHIESVDVNKEWDYGLVGKLTTTPAIVFESLASVGAGVVSGGASNTTLIGVSVGLVGLALVGMLWLIRRHRRTWIAADDVLHTIFHCGRDQINEIVECSEPTEKRLLFNALNQRIVDSVSAYFRNRLHDESITTCLRLAVFDAVEGDTYQTVARSIGMDANRDAKTVSIRADEGIAKAFLEKEKQGVFLFQDFDKAKEVGWWKEMPNDRLPDANTTMIAPINGWARTDKVMFGMLFVWSKNKVFQPAHSLPLKSIVDYLGVIYQAQLIDDHRDALKQQQEKIEKKDSE